MPLKSAVHLAEYLGGHLPEVCRAHAGVQGLDKVLTSSSGRALKAIPDAEQDCQACHMAAHPDRLATAVALPGQGLLPINRQLQLGRGQEGTLS